MDRTLAFKQPIGAQIDFLCPICDSNTANYSFRTRGLRVMRCAGCGLTFSDHPFKQLPPDARKTAPIFLERSEKDHTSLIAALDGLSIAGPVLVLSDSDDGIVKLLGKRGHLVARASKVEEFNEIASEQRFSAVVVSDAIMRVPNPRTVLEMLRRNLAAGAPLVLSLPLLDGLQARLMGRNWHEWRAPNRWFFSRETLSLLLLAAGFEHIWFRTIRRNYSFNGLVNRLRLAHEDSVWFRAFKALRVVFPALVRNSEFPLPSGGAVVTTSAAAVSSETVVSIVVPVFNEQTTFQAMFNALLAKQLPGIRKEIIVVESNSTDGSRDLVRTYENHPDVRVIYQSAPRGKGNAVREGLNVATGDILMIQDADLEYDLDDYDALLKPLLACQSMFVLGSRHKGDWKIRDFSDAPITAAVFNFGHSVFRTMINVAVHAKMADPFTMFKVFRRESIYGLNFICNRFDFDIELVIKLVRKGYTPLELPVNYQSRSFDEGKKVSVTRDGMTWILTILRARFSPLGDGRA